MVQISHPIKAPIGAKIINAKAVIEEIRPEIPKEDIKKIVENAWNIPAIKPAIASKIAEVESSAFCTCL